MAASQWLSVGEAYANGRFAVIRDLNFSLFREESWQHLPRSGDLGEFEFLSTLVFVTNVPHPVEFHARDKQPVLVRNVESVQGPDGISDPSLVGLYDIHDEVDDPFGGLIFESAIHGVYKFIPSFVYRKLCVYRPLSGGLEFEVAGDVIERGAQIMQTVSDNAHKFPWHGYSLFELEQIIASIRVGFNEDSVRVSVDPRQKITQVADVLFGPLNL